MARTLNKLTALKVGSLSKPGRYADGGGLYLQVTPSGTKSWLFRFMLQGHAREMGLGSCNTFTLAEARERARQARQSVTDKKDPIEVRLSDRDARRAEESERITFKVASQRYLKVHETGWKNEKHRQQWRNTLRDYAYPTLGNRPVSAITGALISEALAPIWTTKAETASRVKQRIERVLQWVKDGMPLPAPSKARRVKHHKALPYAELPDFMARLRSLDSISARALEFTILTAARTGEVIEATWGEIDLDGKVWIRPGEHMKAHKEHRVPLCDRALAILDDLPREKGNPYLFVGATAGKGLSNMAMLECLRGLAPGLTVHGFRSTFKDWAAERTSYPNIVSEMALAHTVADKVEAAYRRGDLFEKRRRLMREWGRFAAEAPAGQVIAIAGSS
jgi:integrase